MSKRQRNPNPKPKNKTYVTCTLTNQRVKGLIVEKTDSIMTVDLPTGYQMQLVKKPKRKLYAHYVGMLEFISDGWAVS
jgi:hypothetical protein